MHVQTSNVEWALKIDPLYNYLTTAIPGDTSYDEACSMNSHRKLGGTLKRPKSEGES